MRECLCIDVSLNASARSCPDTYLDIQAAVDACFSLVGYERLLDYSAPPPPELPAEDAEWVNQVLQAAGLRPR